MNAARVLGAASLLSAVFWAVDDGKWQFVKMTGETATVALVLGVLTIAIATWDRLVAAAGLLFLLAAAVQFVELARKESWLGGSAATLSVWLGLGVGLLLLGLYRGGRSAGAGPPEGDEVAA